MSKNKDLRLIDKPLYNYWQAIVRSFYSPRLYLDVSKRWRGMGALYILLVVAVFSIPLSIRFIGYMTDYINNDVLAPLEKMPPLYVQGGQISIDEPMPYKIKNDHGQVVAIIDTKADIKQLPYKYPNLATIIAKDAIYFRQPKPQQFLGSNLLIIDKEFSEYKLRPEDTEVFDPKQWIEQSGVLTVRLIAQVLIYPIVVIFFYALYFVLLITLPMLGQLLAQVFFNFKLRYIEACRIFAVAATPQMLLFFLLLTFNVAFPGLGFIYVAILAGYYCFALAFIKREKKKMVHA